MADRSISVRIQAVVSDFQRGMSTATNDLKGFQRQAQLSGADVRQSMTSIGVAAGAASLAIAAGLGAGVKAAIEWESAFAGVEKTVDGTAAELAVLEQGLRDMAQEIPVAHEELAGIAEAAGQLGIEKDNILGFTEAMAAMSVATNLTSDEAATMIAQFANITQMPQDKIENLGSAIVALGNDGASTEKQIAEMGLRIAGAGAQIGLSEAEILGFSSALASVGIEAEAGGSAISRVFIEIEKAVRGGGEELGMFAEVAGMSADEFATAYRDDAAGAIITFIEGLGGISDAGGDVFGVLEALELQDIRVRDALLRASGAGDLFRDSIELGSRAFEENTALGEEAEKRYATVESQLILAGNALKEVGIIVGEILLPVIVPMIEGVRDLAKWFSELPKPVQTTGVVLAAVAATLLGIAATALILGPRILMMANAWRTLAGSARAAAAAQASANVGTGFGLAGVRASASAPTGVITSRLGRFAGAAGGLATAGASIAVTAAVEEGIQLKQEIDEGQAKLASQLAELMRRAELGDEDAAQRVADFRKKFIDDQSWWSRTMFFEVGAQSEQIWAQAKDIAETAKETAETAGMDTAAMAQGYQDYADAMAQVGGKTSFAAESTYDYAAAQRELNAAIIEAMSPVSQAIGALDRLRQAEENLKEIKKDDESTTEDIAEAQWEYVESLWAAQAALDQIDPSQLEVAIDSIADALDISREEAAGLLEQLGVLDGMTVSTVIETRYRQIGRAPSTRFLGPVPDEVFGGTGKAAGGPVTAGSMYRVGEGNQPELLSTPSGLFMIPGESGRVFSNRDSQRMMGGNNLTINMRETGDPQVDAQRVGAVASVMRRMETV